MSQGSARTEVANITVERAARAILAVLRPDLDWDKATQDQRDRCFLAAVAALDSAGIVLLENKGKVS